jgi:hypothetical protein
LTVSSLSFFTKHLISSFVWTCMCHASCWSTPANGRTRYSFLSPHYFFSHFFFSVKQWELGIKYIWNWRVKNRKLKLFLQDFFWKLEAWKMACTLRRNLNINAKEGPFGDSLNMETKECSHCTARYLYKSRRPKKRRQLAIAMLSFLLSFPSAIPSECR